MLLKNIGIGDSERSLSHLDCLIELQADLPAEERFAELKLLSSELNVLLRHLCHSYKVHAHYSEEVYQRFRHQTDSCTLFSQLQKVLPSMVTDYLKLIRDYSRRHYSNLIRASLDYIDFHFAELCGFSSSNYFARVFQQQMGMSPTSYRKQSERFWLEIVII